MDDDAVRRAMERIASAAEGRPAAADVDAALERAREQVEALEIIDRLAHKYTGQPFPMRSGTVYVVEVERASFAELPFRHEPA